MHEDKLAEWYNKKTEFICLNMPGCRHPYFAGEPNARERYIKLSEKFEQENPKPDWRSLL